MKLIAILIFLIFISGCLNASQQINENTIIIDDFSFNPSLLKVKAGTAITWINKDSVKHSVISSNNIFSSTLLAKGEKFTFTFNEKGEFLYSCSPHQYMKAKIIVE